MQGKISVMLEASQREAMAGPKEERGRERKAGQRRKEEEKKERKEEEG